MLDLDELEVFNGSNFGVFTERDRRLLAAWRELPRADRWPGVSASSALRRVAKTPDRFRDLRMVFGELCGSDWFYSPIRRTINEAASTIDRVIRRFKYVYIPFGDDSQFFQRETGAGSHEWRVRSTNNLRDSESPGDQLGRMIVTALAGVPEMQTWATENVSLYKLPAILSRVEEFPQIQDLIERMSTEPRYKGRWPIWRYQAFLMNRDRVFLVDGARCKLTMEMRGKDGHWFIKYLDAC